MVFSTSHVQVNITYNTSVSTLPQDECCRNKDGNE
jgi:hypothetical protein